MNLRLLEGLKLQWTAYSRHEYIIVYSFTISKENESGSLDKPGAFSVSFYTPSRKGRTIRTTVETVWTMQNEKYRLYADSILDVHGLCDDISAALWFQSTRSEIYVHNIICNVFRLKKRSAMDTPLTVAKQSCNDTCHHMTHLIQNKLRK